MHDLFEREQRVLERAQAFLEEESNALSPVVKDEFTYVTNEYAQVLRQLRWVTRISDLTAFGLNSDKKALLNKANVDTLTEIYNRRFLITNLDHYLDDLESSGEWITIMMADVDFFKKYNDTYGHSAGDVCLRKIANALHGALTGAEDFVVRYGGEEFIVVLPGANKERGVSAAERILQSIQNMRIPHKSSEIEEFVTISIGLLSMVPKGAGKMQQYIDRVDEALYMSKKNGRNKITYLEAEEE